MQDADKWLTTKATVKQQTAFVNVMQDYLLLRRSGREEQQILKLNRINVEKNEQAQREKLAHHCGLRMPYEPRDTPS